MPVRPSSARSSGANPGGSGCARSSGPVDTAAAHGFPARLIAPNRPGVLQTKWVARLDVLEEST